MDEIFHIPQALTYCNKIFDSWDPKITTPPGLYLAALLLPVKCSVVTLRAINAIFGLGSFFLIRSILKRQYNPVNWQAFNIAMFPVSFFFHFLYYTDSGSTFFVLLAYRLALAKHFKASAIV